MITFTENYRESQEHDVGECNHYHSANSRVEAIIERVRLSSWKTKDRERRLTIDGELWPTISGINRWPTTVGE